MANTTLQNALKGKYFVKKKESDSWEDITIKFNGIKILSIDGLNEQGEAVNIYNEQWIDSQKEDFYVANKDKMMNDVVIRKNMDVTVSFVCSNKFANNSDSFDVSKAHDDFIDFMCNNGDLYIMSKYADKSAHVICTKGYKPIKEKLHRGENSFVHGSIVLHMLDKTERI